MKLDDVLVIAGAAGIVVCLFFVNPWLAGAFVSAMLMRAGL